METEFFFLKKVLWFFELEIKESIDSVKKSHSVLIQIKRYLTSNLIVQAHQSDENLYNIGQLIELFPTPNFSFQTSYTLFYITM